MLALLVALSLGVHVDGLEDRIALDVAPDGALLDVAVLDQSVTVGGESLIDVGLAGTTVTVGPATPSNGAGQPSQGTSPETPLPAFPELSWALLAPAAVAALRPDLAIRVAARLPRWLAAIPALGLFSRIQDDKLADHPQRRAILDALEGNPGMGVEEVRQGVGIAWGTAVYHLQRLESAGLIVGKKDGRVHRYWPEAHPQARVREAASLLKHDTPAAIAALVARIPGIHQRRVCDEVGVKPPVASKYLKRLESAGLVEAIPDGRRKVYRPTPQLARVHAVL